MSIDQSNHKETFPLPEHEHQHDDHEHPDHDAGLNWERVQAWIQTGILYLLGIYFIDLARPGGNLGNYINVENLGWLTWVAAAIFLAIAVNTTIDLMRDQKHDHHHEHGENHHDHDHDHQHAKAGSVTSWFFLGMVSIPLVLGLGVSSKPLGSDAITSEISADVTALGLSGQPTTVDIPLSERNILDWLRDFATSTDLTEFEGQEIEAIGFVYRDARFAGTEKFMVVRFTLSCCVADARPIGLVVSAANGSTFVDDTWVKVAGKITIQNIDGIDTPVILADSLEETSQPDQPYLYF